MNKAESKYFNTAKRMDEALIALLEEKDFEYITIKEICAKAGVNRSTFYLHYEIVNDLLEECIQYMNDNFLQYFGNKSEAMIDRIDVLTLKELYLVTPEYLVPYLEYIKAHQRLFLTAMKRSATFHLADAYDQMFIHVLNPILDRFSVSEKEKKYLLSFYMNGIMAIIKTWLMGNCEDEIDFIVRMIEERIHRKER